MFKGLWDVDKNIIQIFKAQKFPLVGGKTARIHEIVRSPDIYAYQFIIDIANGTYLRLDFSLHELTESSFDDVVEGIHDDILRATGGNREILNSKVHKALYGDLSDDKSPEEE